MTDRPHTDRQPPPQPDVIRPPAVDEIGLPTHIQNPQLIGSGGMGAVYEAFDKSRNVPVAVKVLLPKYASDQKAMQRFMREAEMLKRLSNPHIVTVFECGTTSSGMPYIVMEFAQGLPLDQAIVAGGPASPEEAMDVLKQCGEALGHAHANGIVHRDLKPGNIIVNMNDGDGRMNAKILDFGISKIVDGQPYESRLTDTGQVLGTPLYMSPEHVLGQTLDGRSDIYALGCVIFETLTGKPPFIANDAYQVLAQQVKQQAPDLAALRPDVPPALCRIVSRMMEKERQDRYQSMDEMIADLNLMRGGKAPPKHLTGEQKRAIRAIVGTILWAIIGFGIAYAMMTLIGAMHILR